jgi:hypothetical protein
MQIKGSIKLSGENLGILKKLTKTIKLRFNEIKGGKRWNP